MRIYIARVLLFLIYIINNCGVAFSFENNRSSEGQTLSYVSDELHKIADFPLRKCLCESNQAWKNGSCVSKKTSVDFILDFWPKIIKRKVDTSEFTNVILKDIQCARDNIIVELNDCAFTKQRTLFHLFSGQNFSENYCLEHFVDSSGVVEMKARFCLQSFRIPTCCEENQLFKADDMSCKLTTKTKKMNPPILLGRNTINITENMNFYVQRYPVCNSNYVQKRSLSIKNGVYLQYQHSEIVLFVNDEESKSNIPIVKFPSDYCITIDEKSKNSDFIILFWNEFVPSECFSSHSASAENEKCNSIMNVAVIALLTLSTFFLLLILAFHAVMPELRKSLGSKITISHVASLFCGFCLLLFLHIPYSFNCKIYGPLIQLSFLAAFFWLNIMCFDIWWKLWCRSPAGETAQSTRSQFLWYCAYGWGFPLAFVVATIILDNIPYLQETPGFITPGFGKHHCWFADRRATLIYYFGIVGLLMAANVFFFIWVFIIIIKANCSYRKLLKNSSNSTKNTWIYMKIFAVMGVSWIFEFLSWQEGTCKYWIVTDIINALRGVILFAIFFGSRKSMEKISRRMSTLHHDLHVRVNRSVNTLRKLSMKPPSTAETGLESQRSSNGEMSNR